MSNRKERIEELNRTFKEYVRKEKDRIEHEVTFLQDVLNGRTNGAGVKRTVIGSAEATAHRDLAEFLDVE